MDKDGAYYKSHINIDGQVYSNCEFLECTLIYGGGDPPKFYGCSFSDTQFAFSGAAANTLDFFAGLYRSDGFRPIAQDMLKNLTGDPQLFEGRQ